MKVYVLVWNHNYGDDVYVFTTRERAEEKRRQVVDPRRRRPALLSTAVPTNGRTGRALPACLIYLGGCTLPPCPPRRLTRP